MTYSTELSEELCYYWRYTENNNNNKTDIHNAIFITMVHAYPSFSTSIFAKGSYNLCCGNKDISQINGSWFNARF